MKRLTSKTVWYGFWQALQRGLDNERVKEELLDYLNIRIKDERVDIEDREELKDLMKHINLCENEQELAEWRNDFYAWCNRARVYLAPGFGED